MSLFPPNLTSIEKKHNEQIAYTQITYTINIYIHKSVEWEAIQNQNQVAGVVTKRSKNVIDDEVTHSLIAMSQYSRLIVAIQGANAANNQSSSV